MPNFISQQAQGRKPTHVLEQQQVETVSWRLSLYSEPPRTVITIEEFERYAIDRLRGVKCFHSRQAVLDCTNVTCSCFSEQTMASCSAERH